MSDLRNIIRKEVRSVLEQRNVKKYKVKVPFKRIKGKNIVDFLGRVSDRPSPLEPYIKTYPENGYQVFVYDSRSTAKYVRGLIKRKFDSNINVKISTMREEVKKVLNEKNIGGHYYKEVKKSLLNKEIRDVDLMEISGSGSGVSYNDSTQQLVIEFEDGTFAVVSGGARLENNGTEKHGVLGFDISK